jgi:hypothetical protein
MSITTIIIVAAAGVMFWWQRIMHLQYIRTIRWQCEAKQMLWYSALHKLAHEVPISSYIYIYFFFVI